MLIAKQGGVINHLSHHEFCIFSKRICKKLLSTSFPPANRRDINLIKVSPCCTSTLPPLGTAGEKVNKPFALPTETPRAVHFCFSDGPAATPHTPQN